MMNSSKEATINAIVNIVNRPQRDNVRYPTEENGTAIYAATNFAQNVFTLQALAKALPKAVFLQFLRQRRGHGHMDKTTADAVAHAVRIWAQERGATHFTHWFQPQNGTTAEKHDSFLSLRYSFSAAGEEVTPIDAFSGSQLLQAEPDASSFPSGGMRTTFEARGYTIWDTRSPMFIQKGPHNTSVLYIPSVFISYNGDALDEKTVLLRSCEAISKRTCELLALIDEEGEGDTANQVFTTLGTEQEFFMVDRELYSLRPDLKICGRSLIGNMPARHQQFEDHYFGSIPSRVLAALSELELELFKLGVPMKTRHNEVAPAQFEVAPIFEEALVAVDHNLITMDMLHKVAHRHKLKCLFHEKPFKGINGSGKHCNWSISTDRGENLLDPSAKPETNYRFLLTLVAVLYAVRKYGGILRAAISSASNDHRLGANEAPPGIISVFLGEQLTEVLDAIEAGRPVRSFSQTQIQTVKLGGTVLDVKIATLPNIDRHLTDRNRTSPFAFTGNKFEFRAVGSKQSPSFPLTLLNAAVASSMAEVIAELRKKMGSKEVASKDDQLAVIKHFIRESKAVRFEGDNYSEDWVKEAERRGLLNIHNSPAAFRLLLKEENKKMLTEDNLIFSPSELKSRYHILMERYVKDLLMEANTLHALVTDTVLPAAFEYRATLAQSCVSLDAAKVDGTPEKSVLDELTPLLLGLQKATKVLKAKIEECLAAGDLEVQADVACMHLLPLLEDVRGYADQLEAIVADKYWPLPKYTELLFFQ